MSFLALFLTLAVPATNPKQELGRALFFDTRMSVDGSRACYSCHKNEDGSGGHDALAVGAKQKQLTRHSPTIWNVGRYQRFYWDGRSTTLEEQGKAAWAGGNMGVGTDGLEAKAQEIGGYYKAQFSAVYGDTPVTADTVADALAEFEKSLACDNTAYDRFKAGDKKALSADQQKGLALFEGKAACVSCHAAPNFSNAMEVPDGVYFNVGIGTDKPEADVDVGRFSVTKQDSDWAAFKIPSLRNITKSAPYFHDGSVKTLAEAVRYMASGGTANKALTPLMQDRKLTDAELKSLVAFLKGLDCPHGINAPKKSYSASGAQRTSPR